MTGRHPIKTNVGGYRQYVSRSMFLDPRLAAVDSREVRTDFQLYNRSFPDRSAATKGRSCTPDGLT